jgi:hypothetical protein
MSAGRRRARTISFWLLEKSNAIALIALPLVLVGNVQL